MPLIIPSNTISGGYEVANSLRFNDGSSDYLNKTFSAENRKTWTYSVWIKRAKLSSAVNLFRWNTNDADRVTFQINSSDKLLIQFISGGSFQYNSGATTRVFRDTSAWYHLVLAVDTTDSTQADRVKLYVNGVQETLSPSTNISQNTDTNVNTGLCQIGADRDTGTPYLYYDGYMAEAVFVDGQQLLPTSFGEFDEDTGIWKPKDVSDLTFGTNGFYLDFEDSSALGNDVSGNNNDFTVNNLTSIDQNEDTCTNNWCTQNPLSYRSGQTVPTYSEGNLKVVYAAGVNTFSYGTIGVQAGKWYWEVKVTFGSNVYTGIGFDSAATNTDINGYLLRQTGQIYNTSGSASSYASALSSGDTVMVAFDADNGTLWFGVNGTWSNSATQTEIENGTTTNSAFSGIDMSSIWLPLSKGGTSSNSNTQSNFGNEIYSISSGNADANGHGNFEYAVPSGYFALCTKNLAEHG